MEQFDVIIVGGGLNSLVTASILGKAGKRVLVLEARNQVGGMASTIEFAPGFKCNAVHDTVKWIDPRLLKKLDLDTNGLELVQPDLVRIVFGNNNDHIAFYQNAKQTTDSILNHSKRDAANWENFTTYIHKLTQFFEKLYQLTPPKLPNVGLKETLGMKSMLGPITKHGARGLVDLLRVAPMMMPELVDEWFENELLKSAISTAAIHHLSFGPFAAGTGYNLLHQHVHGMGVFHNVQFVKGGTANLVYILKAIAESSGVKFQTNTKVKSIEIKTGSCSGVRLINGESIAAKLVVSGLDPNNTFINLVGAPNLNPNFQKQLNNIKYRGSTARIHFALNRLPQIKELSEAEMKTVFSICPSIKYLERASDGVKYGELSKKPYVEFTIPSLMNTDFAPSGKHVLSATVQYAPYHLRDNQWTDNLKSKLKNSVVHAIERVIPGFPSMIDSTTTISPLDLETQFGLTEGNLNHGEMTLDQFLFMRPTMSSAQYKTPIHNLYLCGPGTHPGGGLHGTNGFNAAREILKT